MATIIQTLRRKATVHTRRLRGEPKQDESNVILDLTEYWRLGRLCVIHSLIGLGKGQVKCE